MSQGRRTRALDSRGRPVTGVYVRDGVYSAGYKFDGRWVMKNLDALTLTDARREREGLLAGLREGRIAAPTRTTFQEAFDEWQSSRPITARTRENERYALGHLASIKNRPVQGITANDIAKLLRGMRERTVDGKPKPYAEWTRHGVYRTLCGTFALAVRRGIVTRNPMDGLAPSERPKQVNAKRVAILDSAAIDRLVAAASSERNKAVLGLWGYAGLRMGEVRGLRWEDVDFDASVIRIRRSLLDDGTPTSTKTQAGVRAVPMLPALRRLLVAWKLRSPWPRPTDLVVCTANGGHVLKGNLGRTLRAAKKHAGLDGGEERLSAHSLRHTWTSRLATDHELPATTLAQIAGHADPSFTYRVYARDGRDEAAIVADVLSRVVEAD